MLYICIPMIARKTLSASHLDGVKKGSDSLYFHHFLLADGQLEPSFFLLKNHIFNKSIKFHPQCQSH